MPDHLHLLMEGLEGRSDLRRCVNRVKQRTSYAAVRLGLGRLWQDGYHDRIVRQDENLQHYIDYIVENPVRVGLVRYAEDYPFTFPGLPRKPGSGLPDARERPGMLPGQTSET